MTPQGYERLQQELQRLEQKERPAIARLLRDAIAQGDLSENAAYEDAKQRQAALETRIAELKDTLRTAQVEKTGGNGRIKMGTTFAVKGEDGTTRTFTLTGREEANPSTGKISYDSPLGAAFIDHTAGESVVVETPAGSKTYIIIDITG